MRKRWGDFTFLLVLVLIFSLAALSVTEVPRTVLGGKENASPSDWVKEEQIKVYPSGIILNIPNARWASFTDTNSMDPFFDEKANAIEILPSDPRAIQVGDVISYAISSGVVIHRVVGKGQDAAGVYYLVKGDNNRFQDPFKVRFGEVRGVVVAVIY